MKGEILSIETVQEITETKKIIERLTRDKNFFELESKNVKRKLDRLNKVFDQLENYLPKRIEVLQKNNIDSSGIAILELQKLADALVYERNKLEGREDEKK